MQKILEKQNGTPKKQAAEMPPLTVSMDVTEKVLQYELKALAKRDFVKPVDVVSFSVSSENHIKVGFRLKKGEATLTYEWPELSEAMLKLAVRTYGNLPLVPVSASKNGVGLAVVFEIKRTGSNHD